MTQEESEAAEYDKVTQASLNGIYVKAMELDRGHNEGPAPTLRPPGTLEVTDATARDARTHASDGCTHASDTETPDAESHVSDACVQESDAETHDAETHASTHASD